MNHPHDDNPTVDFPTPSADSLDAGLAAGFGRRMEVPRSSLGNSLRPMLLRDAEGESAHVVKPRSDAMPSLDQTGDRYQLSGEIARGGMGAILRGRDIDLGRDLAIKVLLEKYTHRPEVARRFIEEAQIGGQLQHPGVVPVYDIGHFGDRPFFTMKLVKGQTLAALLSERSDSTADLSRLINIALQVTQTLAYAHAKGVIHRDLKPANIMVGAFGEVQVMDWGLAKVLAEGGIADEERQTRERERLEKTDVTTIRTARSTGSSDSFGTDTEAGSLLGTPAYMPPEQANGDVGLLDRRADVFGLGAILCEILTGKPPYVGRSGEEVRRKAANGDLVEAISRIENCGADLELILLTKTCLAAEPIDRPKDAQAVADGLTAYLNGVQTKLHQAELAEAAAKVETREEIKRRRLANALAVSVLLLLAVGGGSLWWMDHQAEQRRIEEAIAQAARESEFKHRQEVTGRDVVAALEQVENLISDARKQEDDAEKMGLTLKASRSNLAGAELSVAKGDVSQETRLQVVQSAEHLRQADRDWKLLSALEKIWLDRGELSAGAKTDLSESNEAENGAGRTNTCSEVSREHRMAAAYRDAFRQYDWDVQNMGSSDVVRLMEKHPHRIRLLLALAQWANNSDKSEKSKLNEILDGVIEPVDSYRGRLRTALKDHTGTALAKIAQSADSLDQPPASIEFLAGQLQNRYQRQAAINLLRNGTERYPGNVWLHYQLALMLLQGGRSNIILNEAAQHATAVHALRPRSAMSATILGWLYFDQQDYLTALKWGQRYLLLDPTSSTAHNNIGVLYHRMEKDEEASSYLRKAIDLNPSDFVLFRNLVQLRFSKGIETFRDLVNRHPQSPHAQFLLGIAYLHANEPAKAATQWDTVFSTAGNNDFLNYGELLTTRGFHSIAQRFYEKAMKQENLQNRATYGLGKCMKEAGKINEAIQTFETLAQRAPQWAAPHCELANIALDHTKRFEACLAEAQKAIALEPDNSWAHNLLGCAMRDLGKTDDAIVSFIKAKDLDPDNPAPCRNLGLIYAGRKQYDQLEAAFKELFRIEPNNARWRCDYVCALRDCGKLKEALQACRVLQQKEPNNSNLLNNLGTVLRDMGQIQDAIDSFQASIKVNPSYVAPHRNLGLIYFKQKDEVNGEKAFKEVFRIDPQNAQWRSDYGFALREQGHIDQAIASYREAIRLNPELAEAYMGLGYCLELQGHFSEALTNYKLASKIDPKSAWANSALGRVEPLIQKQDKLLALWKGNYQPRTNQERLEFAWACYTFKRYRLAHQLYAEAFASDPKLAEDVTNFHRYNAACTLILNATEQEKDAARIDDQEKQRLRKQALDWLRADLIGNSKKLESGKLDDSIHVLEKMHHWQKDADLASIRDSAVLAQLPADEQKAFTQFWADVAALLKKAEEKQK